MYEAVLEAVLTGAHVDMYLDEVSSGTAVACYVNRLQIYTSPAQTPTTPATQPPNPNSPTRDYYGALALSSEEAAGPWVYGVSANQNTTAEAELLAVSVCENHLVAPGDSCSVEERFVTGECLAVFSGNNGLWVGWRTGPRLLVT